MPPPSGIVFDTSVLIENEHERFDIRTFPYPQSVSKFCVAAVTVAELWHGFDRDKDPARKLRREAKVGELFTGIDILDYTAAIARRHSRLWAALEEKGKRIGRYDMIIAATCLFYGYKLVTFNKDEFREVAGLLLIEETSSPAQTSAPAPSAAAKRSPL
jgi:tRNA(fMet)-specific endonuclease VapC